MSTPTVERPATPRHGFLHEALFYAGDGEFVRAVGEFIREGAEAGEAVFVAVPPHKIELLEEHVGAYRPDVRFADMLHLGRNPGRIIPAWHDFVAEQQAEGRPFRGVGEPVWPERAPAELEEAVRHEALLNVAFANGPAWWLLCPYDTAALPQVAIEAALRAHPSVITGRSRQRSHTYANGSGRAAIDGPLPQPPGPTMDVDFTTGPLHAIRELVAAQAERAGLDRARVEAIVLAANELASNSLRYGGGGGRLRVWQEPDRFICEVTDAGCITNPLVGRARPGLNGHGGRGLWLVHQLCDLVELRSSAAGTVVRVHMLRPAV